jgi:aspartate aminotransferase
MIRHSNIHIISILYLISVFDTVMSIKIKKMWCIMQVSKRVLQLKDSPLRKLTPLIEAKKKEGKTFIHFNIGQPDLETPQCFFDAIQNFKGNNVPYAPSLGIPPLIEAIQGYFKHQGISFKSNEIIVTTGSSEAIFFVMNAICDPFDEVLIPEPYYVNTVSFMKQLDVVVKGIPTYASDRYHLPSMQDIETHITPRTKAIMLTHPNNPTGTVYSEYEMEMLKEIAIKHHLYLVVDEVYTGIVYDQIPSRSFASLEDLDDHVVIIDSVSKRYSSCGARIGAIASRNHDLMKEIGKLAQARLSAPTLEQIGAVALYNISPSFIKKTSEIYECRRNVMVNALKDLKGIHVSVPEGAFYCLVDTPFHSAEAFALWCVEHFHVNHESIVVAPAQDFYSNPKSGAHQIRLAFVHDIVVLEKGLALLKEAIKQYTFVQKSKNV